MPQVYQCNRAEVNMRYGVLDKSDNFQVLDCIQHGAIIDGNVVDVLARRVFSEDTGSWVNPLNWLYKGKTLVSKKDYQKRRHKVFTDIKNPVYAINKKRLDIACTPQKEMFALKKIKGLDYKAFVLECNEQKQFDGTALINKQFTRLMQPSEKEAVLNVELDNGELF